MARPSERLEWVKKLLGEAALQRPWLLSLREEGVQSSVEV